MQPVNTKTNSYEASGTGETVGMTIQADKAMFDLMIKNIYSRGFETINRELISNAHDAHMIRYGARANDITIDITLPTAIDPVFKVRDKGPGMTHDFVMRNYSVMGFSTKSASNGQTGMFGIGSKSPLSVSDTFTLRIFDSADSVRIYTISTAAVGTPQITHVFDAKPLPSDRAELGGVEVSVPIKREDQNKIVEGLVATHFCWFDKSIKFDGDASKLNNLTKFVKVTDRFWLAPRVGYTQTTKFVRQGSATYPLDETQVDLSAYRDIFGLFDKSLIYFDLPIGTFDVTAAREQARYNPESIRNMKTAITAILDGYRAELSAEYKAAGSYEAYMSLMRAKYGWGHARVVSEFVVPNKDIPGRVTVVTAERDDATEQSKKRILNDLAKALPKSWEEKQAQNELGMLPKYDMVLSKGQIVHKASVADGYFSYASGRHARPACMDIASINPGMVLVLSSRRNAGTIATELHEVIKKKFKTNDFSRGSIEGLMIRTAPQYIPALRTLIEAKTTGMACLIIEEGVDWVPTPAVARAPQQKAPKDCAPVFNTATGSWGGPEEISDGRCFYVLTGKDQSHISEAALADIIKNATGQGFLASPEVYRIPVSRLDSVLKSKPDMVPFLETLRPVVKAKVDATGTSIWGLSRFNGFNTYAKSRLLKKEARTLVESDQAIRLALALDMAHDKKRDLIQGQSELIALATSLNLTLPLNAADKLPGRLVVEQRITYWRPLFVMLQDYGDEGLVMKHVAHYFRSPITEVKLPKDVLATYKPVLDWFEATYGPF